MLFGKRKRVVKRILIVEDEPLTAFDTETMLADFGYEVVATIDDFDEAIDRLDREVVHLVIADVRLHGSDLGIELARNARVRGVPTLLATGHEPPPPSSHEREILDAEDDLVSVDPPARVDESVTLIGRRTRGFQALSVALAVLEPQRILADLRRGQNFVFGGVEQLFEARLRPDPVMPTICRPPR